jgi:hypothetical protein
MLDGSSAHVVLGSWQQWTWAAAATVTPWVVNGNKKKAARLAVLRAVYASLRSAAAPEPPEPSHEVLALAKAAFE